MAFTAQELANISASLLDFHVRGPAYAQSIQDRPFYDALMSGQKTFPGGKEFITEPVKGVYTTTLQGFDHDDEVGYANPANIKRTSVKWYELHAGISLTLTELKKEGISVTDSLNSKSTTEHSDRDVVVLTNLLEDKIDDLMEGFARSFTEMIWRDGTQDAKAVPGIQSFILNAPTVGTTFGIDRGANSWWRNRANISIDSTTASNQNLVNALQKDFRQLRRFRGRPNKFLAGSDYMDFFEKELRNKGNYTLEGWAQKKRIDASVADIAFKGVDIEYEPVLDDLSLSKFGYIFDLRRLYLKSMDGEDRKTHAPARPAERYVMYRSMTWTGALCASQLNCHEVSSCL